MDVLINTENDLYLLPLIHFFPLFCLFSNSQKSKNEQEVDVLTGKFVDLLAIHLLNITSDLWKSLSSLASRQIIIH